MTEFDAMSHPTFTSQILVISVSSGFGALIGTAKTGPTLHNISSANRRRDGEFRPVGLTTNRSCRCTGIPADSRRPPCLFQSPTGARRPDEIRSPRRRLQDPRG